MVTSVTAQQVTKVLSDLGFDFTLDKDGSGDPLIRMELKGGYKEVLFFYDDYKEHPGYESLQLYAAFSVKDKIPLQTVNNWNLKHRFARVYLDDEQDPAIESDLDLSGGVSLKGSLRVFLENFAANFETFKSDVVGEE